LCSLLCLLGLLFLLAKEEHTRGYVEVSVIGENLHHVAQIPISHQTQIARVRQDVAHAQSLAAAAG
jgi:hypothetical protein